MISKTLMTKIEKLAENKEWKTFFHEQVDRTTIEFENYTDRGQNLIVTIVVDNKSKQDDIATALFEYWQSYDPDEETSYWIGSDGHGKNGAPYHISDILEDMKQAEKMIEELYLEMTL